MKTLTTIIALLITLSINAQKETKMEYNKPQTEVMTLIKGEVWADGGDIVFKNSKGEEIRFDYIPEGIVKCTDDGKTGEYGMIQEKYFKKKYEITYEFQKTYDWSNFVENGRNSMVVTKMVPVN